MTLIKLDIDQWFYLVTDDIQDKLLEPLEHTQMFSRNIIIQKPSAKLVINSYSFNIAIDIDSRLTANLRSRTYFATYEAEDIVSQLNNARALATLVISRLKEEGIVHEIKRLNWARRATNKKSWAMYRDVIASTPIGAVEEEAASDLLTEAVWNSVRTRGKWTRFSCCEDHDPHSVAMWERAYPDLIVFDAKRNTFTLGDTIQSYIEYLVSQGDSNEG